MAALQSIENLGYGRKIFSPEHEAFRATARRFFQKEIEPNVRQWQKEEFFAADTPTYLSNDPCGDTAGFPCPGPGVPFPRR